MLSPRLQSGLVAWLLVACASFISPDAAAQNGQRPSQEEANSTQSGQFFTIEQPLTTDSVARLKAAARSVLGSSTRRGEQPVLLFEIGDGRSDFGPSYDLAAFISLRLGGAKKTVAYIPRPLTGYAMLVALACDEIVLGEEVTLGPISPSDEPLGPGVREIVRELAKGKGRSEGLAVGLLEPDVELRRVRTADGRIDYVLAAEMPTYRQFHQVTAEEDAWQGSRGVLTAERARADGFANRTAESRAEVAAAYGVSTAAADGSLLSAETRAYWARVDRPVDGSLESFLRRQLAQARQQNANLIVFEFDVTYGEAGPADTLAERIAGLRGVRTVAFINEQAMGPAALMALACDEIVFRKGSKLGNMTGQGDQVLDDRRIAALADRAGAIARAKGYPEVVARALVDPSIQIVKALDQESAAVLLVDAKQVRDNPDRFREQGTVKAGGSSLTVTDQDANRFGLSRHVVADENELKDLYGLRGKTILVNRATWVDALVTALNTPWMSGFLLFLGIFMLVLEMKLPGIGLPAITAALAFLLFFWSRYLGGTADQLEIILFLVGLVCLALELFVFPGFGIFGMSGVILVLGSLVMASHTFIWPSDAYEYRMMGRTLLQVVLALVGVLVGAAVVGRYFPSMPLFNRLVLQPTPYGEENDLEDPFAKPALESESSLAYLLGETGRTTTVLRPTGKARFGERLVEVTADGFFIERDSLVEVVDIKGSRVIVRKVDLSSRNTAFPV